MWISGEVEKALLNPVEPLEVAENMALRVITEGGADKAACLVLMNDGMVRGIVLAREVFTFWIYRGSQLDGVAYMVVDGMAARILGLREKGKARGLIDREKRERVIGRGERKNGCSVAQNELLH